MGERDRIEVFRDIRVNHPPLAVLNDALAQVVKGAAVDAAPGSGEHRREGLGTHALPRAKPWFIGSSWQRPAIGRKELTPSVPPEPLLSP